MRGYRQILTLVVLLSVSSVAFSQVLEKTRASEAGQTQLDSLRLEGSTALFNSDFETARQKFTEIKRLFPEHPAGSYLLASTLWLQKLNESRRLQSALYNSNSFYATNEDKVDPRLVGQFRVLTREAIMLAKARLKSNPRDVDMLYFLGATEGLKAAFEATVQRSFGAALRDGASSVDHHRQVIKLDPNYHDAELTIGLYDYVVGSLPLPVKLLASVVGVRGSKKRGIATLERVAKEGRWARHDAQIVLLALYKREKRFNDALALSCELGAQYPHSDLLKLETAESLASRAAVERQNNNIPAATNLEREAFALFEAMLHDREAVRSYDLIHFRFGESLLLTGHPELAAKEFLAFSSAANAEPELITMAQLRAAQALDLMGKRNEAVAHYRAVLNRPNVYDTYDQATRGLREPYHR
jgi:hypothetical protein